ncbi:hypothetical protein PALB_6580 [Pseudoalteromonas luteoviolacea B = ATCC 29581]|nr:hypothetical protein PALB_6580 [Pseudoalteromonas luteoviolacea B = ATCC 29581]
MIVYKQTLWLVAVIFAGFIPAAICLSMPGFSNPSDSFVKPIAVFEQVDAILADKTLSQEQKKAKIIHFISQPVKNDTTLFMYDLHGKLLSYSHPSPLIGRVLTSHADPIVARAFQELVRSANASTEATVHYHWKEHNARSIVDNVAYIRRIDHWNWVFAASVSKPVQNVSHWFGFTFLAFILILFLSLSGFRYYQRTCR